MLFHRIGILKKHFRKAFPYEKMPLQKWSLAGEAFLKSISGIDSPYEKCLSKNGHSPGKHFWEAFWMGISMKMLGTEIVINGQIVINGHKLSKLPFLHEAFLRHFYMKMLLKNAFSPHRHFGKAFPGGIPI